MRKTSLLFALSITVAAAFAQVKSPEQFLGYPLGSRFTPHWKLVNYFQHVAQQAPDVDSLYQYGTTNEGRPLLVTFICSPENRKKLEGIRKNNLRLANLIGDGVQPDPDAPAIVWLSYNVHGNEPSSSEAAMLTLFALVDPTNTRTKEWLRNTVVVIDPCINPDGRDRYVNWFNSFSGKQFNADPQSREHVESWPGGRTNHYNFDLNRDWAWQSQLESQQRVKLYNDWLPQVHADFHEQSYNNPYYFAPAAEPYHEVITPWQKEFQTMIGRNNAKYFDQQGWLYFTKGGGYDLFYPSYGDTYPTFHGAIGMTYEQGGSGAGGLAVVTADGDTLTLEERLTHHHATSLSTIEISSQNAGRLIKEFRKFYSDALASPSGEYKAYLVKRRVTDADLEGVLNRYLHNNGISYGYAQSRETLKGFNYISGKEETVTVDKDDIIITAFQPKSVMLKVLFEPRSKQGEVLSEPYDITAWSLPYALGLEAYGVKEPVKQKLLPAAGGNRLPEPVVNINSQRSAYAYVIPWKHLSSARVLARLLKTGVRVRYHQQPFSVNGKNYDAGTLIVTKAANARFGDRLYDTVYRAALSDGDLHPVQSVYSGFVEKGVDLGGSKVRVIQVPHIALITGETTDANAFGTIWHFFEQQLDYPVSLIYATDFSKVDWRKYNVIIIPNGTNYRFLTDRILNEQLKSWVRQGGKLIAMGGAIEQLANADWGIKSKVEDAKKKKELETEEEKDPYLPVKKYENRTRDELVSLNSGTIYKVQLDNSHPLGYGYPDYYFTLKTDNAVYEFLREGGWNVGILKKDNYISGFLGSKAQEKLKDGLLLGVQEMGRGSIVYLADDVLFRGFWENGKLLFCNAIFMVGQ